MAALSFDDVPLAGEKPKSGGALTFDDVPAAPSFGSRALEGFSNLGRGITRGARDLIDGPAYLLAKGFDKLAGTNEAARVSDINKAAEEDYQSSTPGSVAAGVGRVGANIGSAFTPGTGQISAANKIADLWKAGNYAKSLAAAGGLGAVQNSLLGTKTEDDSLALNAALGGALAPAAQVAGVGAGKAIQAGRELLAGKGGRVGRVIATAGSDSTEALTPGTVAGQIGAGNVTLVPGAEPTTAQAAMNPGISQLQRTVANVGNNSLMEKLATQNEARIAALDSVAPGAIGTESATAAENAGQVISQQANEYRNILREAIRGAYNDPRLKDAALMAPEQGAVKAVVERFYPGSAFDAAPFELKRMVARLTNGEAIPLSEFDALRKIVGNRARDLRDTDRTASAAFSSVKGLFDDAEEAAITRSADKFAVTGQGQFGPVYGNLNGDPQNAVAHLLQMQTGEVPGALTHADVPGGKIGMVYGKGGNDGHGIAKISEKHMEALQDPQGFIGSMHIDPAASGPNRIRLTDDDLRRGIVRLTHNDNPADPWLLTAYEKQNPALGGVSAPGTRTDTAGLGRGGDTARSAGTASIDDILTRMLSDAAEARSVPPPPPRDPRQYVGGLLAPDQAEVLADARRFHGFLKDRYESGPAAGLWRTGMDGRPVLNGGEVPKAFFSSKASQAADIDQFTSMLPGNDDALAALRQYGIADLAQQATGPTGNLSFPKTRNWMNQRAEAIPGLYNAEQQQTLGAVRNDLGRAFEAENLGRATGSNTAQNLLGAGVLDSRAASALAGFIPRLGPAGLEAMRQSSRRRVASEVGDALIDPRQAISALRVFEELLAPNAAQRGLRVVPQVAVPAASSLGANH